MCTLTYLPLDNGQFLLTSSRDEGYQRKNAVTPTMVARSHANILCPVDGDAKGTWIAIGDNGLTCCLLNGGFELHERQLPYRKSRGIMVMEIFDHLSVQVFLDTYDLDRIEPFTLALIETSEGNVDRVTELKWDGEQKHIKSIDPKKPYMWSSTTLYDTDMRTERQGWFDEWLETKPAFTRESIVHFHEHAGSENPNIALKMNRPEKFMDRPGGVQTVSITSVKYTPPTEISMQYEDVLAEKKGIYHFQKPTHA